jgi:hypothetical protein
MVGAALAHREYTSFLPLPRSLAGPLPARHRQTPARCGQRVCACQRAGGLRRAAPAYQAPTGPSR